MSSPVHCPLCLSPRHHALPVAGKGYYRCLACELVWMDEADHLDEGAEKAVYDGHDNRVDDPRYRAFLMRAFGEVLARVSPHHQHRGDRAHRHPPRRAGHALGLPQARRGAGVADPAGTGGRSLQDLALSPRSHPYRLLRRGLVPCPGGPLAGRGRVSSCGCGGVHQTLSRAFSFGHELGNWRLRGCCPRAAPEQPPPICLPASDAWRCCR